MNRFVLYAAASLCAAASLALAPSALADDGTYRCMAETVTHWTGDHEGVVENLPPGEYEIALDMLSGENNAQSSAVMVATGAQFDLDLQYGDPSQLLAHREDGRFTMRIDLDATPMRFAGIGETTLLTGTCFFEPRTTK